MTYSFIGFLLILEICTLSLLLNLCFEGGLNILGHMAIFGSIVISDVFEKFLAVKKSLLRSSCS